MNIKKIITDKAVLIIISSIFLNVISCKNKDELNINKDSFTKLYTTTLDQNNLLKEELILPGKPVNVPDVTIIVDTNKTFQRIDGFGYTLTGGSAMLINKMSTPAKKMLLQELFGTGKDDIGVSYLRISIGASDLDEKPWSYNDLPEGETDLDLQKFSLANDTLHLIPVIKDILKITPDIKIMGSPWSPPAWMKDNNDTRGGSLKTEYYKVYANYFLKYIKAMKSYGIKIDAITVQNEPLHPGNNPSLLMLPEQQLSFIKNYLGPTFKNNDISTKIIIYDHNADRPDYPISILNDPDAAQYIDGSAFHLYGGTIDALTEVHEAHPNKNLYFTEQWIGAPGNFKEDFSWHVENIVIGAMRNWCKTSLEWNLAADENQNPHTDRGGCTSCLGAITIIGDTILRNPAYYVIAHASKFVRPESVRIDSNISDNIINVAFRTSEGNIVVIIQNRNEQEKTIAIKVEDESVQIKLTAGAVGTLIL